MHHRVVEGDARVSAELRENARRLAQQILVQDARGHGVGRVDRLKEPGEVVRIANLLAVALDDEEPALAVLIRDGVVVVGVEESLCQFVKFFIT